MAREFNFSANREQSKTSLDSAEVQPKIEGRAFKDSGIEWIGQIPKEWDMAAIKRLMCLYAGATPKSDDVELWNGNIPWITPADYKTEDVFVSQGRRSISEKGLHSCATTILPVNSIVFSKRAPIGLVVLNSVPLCTNQGCIGCVPKDNATLSKYYYYVLSAFTEQFELYGAGTTFKEISATNFSNFIVCIPPLSTQQKIVDYLDKVCGEVDDMVALQETMIEELKAYKQSVITEAVTKGINPNVPMRDCGIDWIGEIPEHWGYIKLKSITERIGDGLHGTPIYVPDSSMYFINGNNLGKKNIEIYASTNKIDKNEFDKYYIELDLKTILISLNGTIGNLSFYNGEDIILGKSAGYIVLKDHISKEYIYYCLQADNIKEYFLLSLSGTTIGNLSLRTLRNTPIALPPLDEQRTIATYLDTKCSEIDSLIALKQAKIEELKEYKKSVIYEYVTGKKEVI